MAALRGRRPAIQCPGDRNGLLPTRLAKVVPISMEGSDSAELFMRACNGNREHATTGQEQQEPPGGPRGGEQWPSGGGAGGVSGRAKRRERSHQSATKTPRRPHISCTTTQTATPMLEVGCEVSQSFQRG
jgi:hypothetical protein